MAVVGYLPLEDPGDTAAQLPALAADPLVVGARALIHDHPDPGFLLRPPVRESLGLLAAAGLAFDVVPVLPRHLEHVPVLAAEHPGLRLVVDHLSGPPLRGSAAELATWRRRLHGGLGGPAPAARGAGPDAAAAVLGAPRPGSTGSTPTGWPRCRRAARDRPDARGPVD